MDGRGVGDAHVLGGSWPAHRITDHAQLLSLSLADRRKKYQALARRLLHQNPIEDGLGRPFIVFDLTGAEKSKAPHFSALPGMSPSFSGDALTVRSIVRADPLGAGFRRGDLFQEGSNNTLRGTTLGSPLTVTGDNNSFATYQNGTGNEIIGSINGNTNQAGVAQIGNGNTAAMNQIGNGNNLGISL